jgi:hypothetical protein
MRILSFLLVSLAFGGRWIAHTPWAGDFGDAAFTDPHPDFAAIHSAGWWATH